jgi:LysM repeat protein
VVCAIAVFAVIGSSLGGGDSGDGDTTAPTTADRTASDTTATTEQRTPATYTVEPGDTLGGISEQTGVPVDTIQVLNPELDPQALIAGQKIKLRE